MMTKTDYKRPAIVGAFILAGLAMLIAGVFTIGSQEKMFVKKISLFIVFDDVGGLQPGNNVWLSGVKVGTVRNVSFLEDRRVRITLAIQKKAQHLISKDARAKISTDGFIGNKIVILYGGSLVAGRVSDGDRLTSEQGISTDQMMATLQSSNNNLWQITNAIKEITRKIGAGEGTLGQLVNNDKLLQDIQATAGNLKTASLTGMAAFEDIKDFTGRLDHEQGFVNELITDTTVFNDLRSTVQQFNGTIALTDSMLANLRMASNRLKGTDGPLGVALNDTQSAENLKILLEHLRSSSEKLDANLEALQHNFLLRGYFRKKAKGKIP